MIVVEKEPRDLDQPFCEECFAKRDTPGMLPIFRITIGKETVICLCQRHIGELTQAMSKAYFQ